MDILEQILAAKGKQLEDIKKVILQEQLREQAIAKRASLEPHALVGRLRNNEGVKIIAEFKRRSPSKGTLRQHADAAATGRIYESAGAAAISVLTEENYFAGSLADLRAMRDAVSIPVLRKDFLFDEYQVYESAAAGADALLLIVAALSDESLSRLLFVTETELGMDALVEVHTKEELVRALAAGARLIGVNNRDLRTFDVSTETSLELARLAPPYVILVSESGLKPEKVRELQVAGYKGFLVGEALMRSPDPEKQLRAFRGEN